MGARLPGWALVALFGILLLATAMRFWRLGDLPPGLYHDEAYNGLDALSILEGREFPQYYEGWELYAAEAHADTPPVATRSPVFFEGNYGREPLHIYLMAVSIALAGATPAAVRAVPAAAGVVAVAATFLAALSLFENPVRHRYSYLLPLLAAFTMAVLFPALHFSRFGVRAMLFPPLAALAVAAFWRGWKTKGRGSGWWMVMAGVLTGLGLYTYAAARLFPLVFALFAIYALWQDRQSLVEHWQQLVWLVVAAIVTAAPLLYFFARYPYFFLFRIGYVANQGAGTVPDAPTLTWFNNIGRVLAGLFWRGETHLRHNLPGRPFTDVMQALLLGTGLLHSLWKWKRSEYAFLLIWFGVMLLPSILSGDAPHFGRLIGAAPPIAILIAVAATWIIKFLTGRSSRPLLVAGCLIILMFLPSLVSTTRDYFGRYANHPQLAADFYLPDWELGQYAAAADSDTALYLTPTQEEMATIYFALGDTDRLRSFTDEGTLLPIGQINDPALYLVRPDANATLLRLQSAFPAGKWETASDNFRPYQVPVAGIDAILDHKSDAIFEDTIKLLGWTSDSKSDGLELQLFWQAIRQPDKDYTAFVHVIDQKGKLIAQKDRPPAGYPTSDWFANEVVIDQFEITLPDGVDLESLNIVTGFYYLPTLERLGEAAVIKPAATVLPDEE